MIFSETDRTNQALDGWRDDKLQRRISLKSDNIEAVLKLVASGRYLSYLPICITKSREMHPLDITGCPYQCITEVFLIANKTSDYGWLSAFFSK